jgi:hypothetical protein
MEKELASHIAIMEHEKNRGQNFSRSSGTITLRSFHGASEKLEAKKKNRLDMLVP